MASPQAGERWCPTCSGQGSEAVVVDDELDDYYGGTSVIEKTCGICGGSGIVDAEGFAEMEAEYGPSYTW